ncbi:MAG: hypothetical protein RL398_2085 [Planctomycetota bacterium]
MFGSRAIRTYAVAASLALHVGAALVATSAFVWVAREADRPPPTCHVQASEPVPPLADAVPLPKTEIERSPREQTVVEPVVVEAIAEPLPTTAAWPREACRPHAEAWRAVVRRAPPPEPPAATPEPLRAPAVAQAGAEPRAEVPSPRPGNCPAPDYPPEARRRGIAGTVVVAFEVAADGSVLAVEVVVGSGSPALDRAALRAAARWRFDGGPGRVEVPFVFELAVRVAATRRGG